MDVQTYAPPFLANAYMCFKKMVLKLFSMHLPCIHWKLNKGTLLQLLNFQWIQGRLNSIVFENETTTHCCWGEEFASVDAHAP